MHFNANALLRQQTCRNLVLIIASLYFAQVKKAIEKGNIEGARIYAQNAIRKKTEQLNFLKVCPLT